MAGRKSKYVSTNNKEWIVAQYIRLSQEDCDTGIDKLESNSITSQKALLDDFIFEHQEFSIYNTYVDDGYTGTDFNRPGIQRLLNDMKNKKFNCIITKDLSRLGRNYIEVGKFIEQIFPLHNIRFIAINDRVDSMNDSMDGNTIIISFKNLINDEYARDTSIKIKTALDIRKKKGEFVGSFSPYGYVKDKNNKHMLIVDNVAAKVVKDIFKWKVDEGLGNISICHRLNDMGVPNPTGYKKEILNQNYNNANSRYNDYSWCPSTIRNILKNDIYIGNTTQGKRKVKSYKVHKVEQVPENEWVTIENTHEPIIDRNTFNRAQELTKLDTRVQGSGRLSIWSGILKCKDCGRAMHKKYCKNSTGKVYEYYICGTYRKKSNRLCTKHTIKVEDIELGVLEAIKLHINVFINFNKLLEQINCMESKETKNESNDIITKVNEKKINKIKELKRYLYEDWKNGDITKTEYIEYKKKYSDDIEKIMINNKSYSEQRMIDQHRITEKNEWINYFKKNKNIFKLDRDIISELIESIEVYENKRIKINFKFKNEWNNV